jgi:hypothetical protein
LKHRTFSFNETRHSKEDLEYTIKAYAEILPRLKLAIENKIIRIE